jgi:cytidylate kinase
MGLAGNDRAQRELEKIDYERTRFASEHFHKDPADPANYDLVLNIEHLSPDDFVRVVLARAPLLARPVDLVTAAF